MDLSSFFNREIGTLTLKSPHKPAEVISVLRDNTQAKRHRRILFLPFGGDPEIFYGKVNENTFEIEQQYQLHFGGGRIQSFPLLIGTVEADENGSIIKITIKYTTGFLVFLAIWVMFLIGFFILTLMNGAIFEAFVLMTGFPYILYRGYKISFRIDSKITTLVFKELLDAEWVDKP